jgi:hypothetical protein
MIEDEEAERLKKEWEKLVSPPTCDAASHDTIAEVREAIEQHEETVVRQEEAIKKIEEEKH